MVDLQGRPDHLRVARRGGGQILADRAEEARTFRKRMVGLLGRKELRVGDGPRDADVGVVPDDRQLAPGVVVVGALVHHARRFAGDTEAVRKSGRDVELLVAAVVERHAIVLNPATPLDWMDHVMDRLDIVLLMSVNPGFGGQKFIPHVLDKARKVSKVIAAGNYNCRLEIDGGVGPANIREVAEAGVDTFVAGSAVFGAATEAFSRRNTNCSIDESFERFAPVWQAIDAAARQGEGGEIRRRLGDRRQPWPDLPVDAQLRGTFGPHVALKAEDVLALLRAQFRRRGLE